MKLLPNWNCFSHLFSSGQTLEQGNLMVNCQIRRVLHLPLVNLSFYWCDISLFLLESKERRHLCKPVYLCPVSACSTNPKKWVGIEIYMTNGTHINLSFFFFLHPILDVYSARSVWNYFRQLRTHGPIIGSCSITSVKQCWAHSVFRWGLLGNTG